MVKFDENVSGHKQKARDTSLWQKIWCVLDGSTLLCYRSEEDEQLTLTACESSINVGYFRKIEEADTKKRFVTIYRTQNSRNNLVNSITSL